MSNDDLRNAFLNAYIPKAKKYGLEIPDEPRIERDEETGTYKVREDDLDWDEFFKIAKNSYEPGVGQINGRQERTGRGGMGPYRPGRLGIERFEHAGGGRLT